MFLYLLFQLTLFVLLLNRFKYIKLSIVVTYLLTSVVMLLGCIGLSLFNVLTSTHLTLFWGFLILIAMFSLKKNELVQYGKWTWIAEKINAFKAGLSFIDITQLLLIALILITTFYLAFRSAPNNHDAMTAHMARLIYWVQNKSISFYPTSELPQLSLDPMASYSILNTFLLSNGDTYANLVQWSSMLISLVGVGLLCDLLKLSRSKQIFAVFLAASLPMGVLQATSTQNDYVLTSYVIALYYFVIRILGLKQQSIPYLEVIAIGIAAGLAILTKTTAYLLILGFLPYLFWYLANNKLSLKNKLLSGLLVILIIVSINFYQSFQRQTLFNNFLGKFNEGNLGYTNSEISGRRFAENILKNLLLHITIEDKKLNSRVTSLTYAVADKYNLDLNHPSNTWDTGTNFAINHRTGDENYTGNMIHFGLYILGLSIFFFSLLLQKKSSNNKEAVILFGATLLSFLFFCLILKWQPWNSRLHLPFFVLVTPIIASSIFSKKLLLFSALLFMSLSTFSKEIYANATKNVKYRDIFTLSRNEQYFISGSYYGDEFIPIVAAVQSYGCETLFIALAPNSFEYPLWPLSDYKLKIKHVFVHNESRHLQDKPSHIPTGCYLVANSREDYEQILSEVPHRTAENYGNFTVLFPTDFRPSSNEASSQNHEF